MKELLFYLVILLANVIQGITGFAGTILAMPFSLRLVGMGTAVPVLNVLGMASGIYVCCGSCQNVDRTELRRIFLVMIPALLAGAALKGLLSGRPRLLYMQLGAIVLLIGAKGLYGMLADGRRDVGASADGRRDGAAAGTAGGNGFAAGSNAETGRSGRAADLALLAASGLVHGMFVCGGPLLIGYLTRRLDNKDAFRATISAAWIVLNGLLLITQIASGVWTAGLLKATLVSLPFLFCGMYLGSLLYKRMSRRFFMLLTYVLLLISAVTLFFK